MRFRDSRFWLVTLTLLATGVGSASATTLNVTAGGIDADGCGPKAAPCRSISRAIAAAAPGDKIVVGPGRYGDLDADGTLGEAGEETGGNEAILTIDKALTIESVEGAATTLIDASDVKVDVVAITASGVTFGKAKKGFTVAHGRDGVFLESGVTGVTVSGVRAVSNSRHGFAGRVSDLVLRGNVAEANEESGFVLAGSGALVTGCRATANGVDGFDLKAGGNVLKDDVASANAGTGFRLVGDGNTLTGSVASGNNLGLLVADSANTTLVGNSILGNVKAGVQVLTPNITITKSNIFGNGAAGTNCGVITSGAGAVTLDKICFGAPAGPGDDPADKICGTIQVLEIIEKVLNISPKVPL